MRRRLPDASNAALRAMAERGVYAPDEFEAWLAGLGWSWQALDRGDYGINLEQALVLFVFEDSVRWCETFLIEPRTGAPWRFFDFQKPSMRAFAQNVIHQDGAEVGKTREIMCLILWGSSTSIGFTVRRPWSLVGAPQQTHLDEIILAVEEQMGVQEDGRAKGSLLSQQWLKPKRTPHTMHRFVTVPLGENEKPGIARVYYRPAGHDGEAFRGVHVNGFGLMDEAAKLKRAVQWTEFYRALMPGCKLRVYSVPDGDRTSGYYQLTQSAIPDLALAEEGNRLFHWPKTIMPAPFYSESREREFVRLYGGRQTPGYVRNVLGEHGDAESPVWSWDSVLPNVHELSDFRLIKFAADRPRNQLAVIVKRIELRMEQGKKFGVEHWLSDTVVDLEPIIGKNDDARREAIRALLRDHVAGASRGVFWAGGDLGESNDPTEIILSEEIGPVMRDALRLSLTGLPYHAQREFIFCLQEIYNWLPHWGIDLGAAGTAVVKDLQSGDRFAEARFEEVLTGFQFANMVDCIDEQGEALLDPRDAAGEGILRVPAKHWATQLITRRLQSFGYSMAYDTEALNWMTNHTSREGAKYPIYAKKDDHTIDARRMQMLRKVYDELHSQVDVFSSAVRYRSAA